MKSLPLSAAILAAALIQGCSATPYDPMKDSVFDVIDRYESPGGMPAMRNGQCPAPSVAMCVSAYGRIGGQECTCVDQGQLTDQLARMY